MAHIAPTTTVDSITVVAPLLSVSPYLAFFSLLLFCLYVCVLACFHFHWNCALLRYCCCWFAVDANSSTVYKPSLLFHIFFSGSQNILFFFFSIVFFYFYFNSYVFFSSSDKYTNKRDKQRTKQINIIVYEYAVILVVHNYGFLFFIFSLSLSHSLSVISHRLYGYAVLCFV